VAGKRYYIEAIHAEGGGGDNIAVTWVLPGGSDPADGASPIPGAYLSAFGIRSGAVAVTNNPSNLTVTEPAPARFTVGADGTPPFTYQWFRDGNPIQGATGPSYTTALTRRSDSGAKFKVQVSNPFSTATSSEATLTVNPDTTPPRPLVVTAVDASGRIV